MSRMLLLILLVSTAAGAVLTGGQRRFLRAHAGRLDSAKQLKRAIVANVPSSRDEVSTMLAAHELIRCQFPTANKKAQAKELAEEISVLVGAEVAQVLGHTALLYRQSPAKIIDFSTEPAPGKVGEPE
jgi:RNA-binding protein